MNKEYAGGKHSGFHVSPLRWEQDTCSWLLLLPKAYGCFFQHLEVTPDSFHSKVYQGIFFPDKMSYPVTQGWATGLLKSVLLMFKGSSLLCRGVVELIAVGSAQALTLAICLQLSQAFC